MSRCPHCGGAYNHAPDLICRGNQVADAEDHIYRGPAEDRPKNYTIKVSHPASELTDEQTVQVRGFINDVLKARTHWLILFAGLLGQTSTALVEDLVGDRLHVMVLRLPDDLGCWLALVPKSELGEAQLQDKIRRLWKWDDAMLFGDQDDSSDLVALPDHNELVDQHPDLYAAVTITVTRLFEEWLKTGRIKQPQFSKALVVSLR